ncbi:MAG TPA: histidine--tRNA ligase [Alphaproteobacteria bacterium]|nr:histidine--tRNA ligase [Alphaproteobacteria bacterium]
MFQVQPVRGTHDILPEESRRHRHVVETAREQAERYGFGEIATPIFEFTEVFQRTMGDTSDVVTKEMYTFKDRGDEQITLRPEYTAGIARAFISGGLRQELPLKFFGSGPMFRYERPQKGRLRQFHQIDAEILGVAEPQADIEVVALGADILAALGLADRVRLEINTLGDPESRTAYRQALVAYFGQHSEKLSQDSRARLERNPLRILDSKDPGDRELIPDAPRLGDYLNQHSADFYAEVRAGLEAIGVDFVHNERLVRGLDYYTHTAYEFVTDELGAQGAVIAGGRYDGLIEALGGPPTPGIGWAGGIERLAMMIAEVPAPRRPVAVVPIGDEARLPALSLAQELRRAGHVVELGFRGNLAKRLKRANKLGARAAVLLGEDELARRGATLRDLDSGEQREVPLEELTEALRHYLAAT